MCIHLSSSASGIEVVFTQFSDVSSLEVTNLSMRVKSESLARVLLPLLLGAKVKLAPSILACSCGRGCVLVCVGELFVVFPRVAPEY